jgi:two-component system, NarL family, nitrate/nitrite response regulator NarL
MNTKSIRIVVVDDHALFRAGLISLLDQNPDLTVVGEAGNGHEGVQVVAKTQPEVILLDVNMPIMDGVTTISEIRKISTAKILMLTISKRQDDLLGAIRAGADGYLLKNSEPEELHKNILLTIAGKSILAPEVTAQVMKVVRDGPQDSSQYFELTRREMEVLQELSQGKTNPQIAADLHISENTVKTHVRKVMEKLGAATRAEAVRVAMEAGIL